MYRKGETVRFTNETALSIRAFGRTFRPGDALEVVLSRDWDEREEGVGEGGPWGWGGYTTAFIKTLGAVNATPDR